MKPWLTLLAGLGLIALPGAQAQIRTDASWGRTATTLSGPRYTIPESLGRLAGSNLFQSFDTFNINSGESANFTTSSSGIANVITRVTGGSTSLINGTLSLTAASGAPAFFFINPAGVTFGAGAQVDVPGAFHVSTANYLRLADGSQFPTGTASTSSLSSAPPEAFGFLGTTRAAVIVTNTEVASLSGRALSVVAGDVGVSNGWISKFGGAGDLRVAAAGADKVEVPLVGALPALRGELLLANGGGILAATLAGETTGGDIRISAGDVAVTNQAQVSSLIGTAGYAAKIDLQASGTLAVTNGAMVNSGTVAAGDAGAISIRAGALVVNGQGNVQTGITSDSSQRVVTSGGTSTVVGGGNAADIRITTQGDVTVTTGTINSSTSSAGRAGQVDVAAGGNLLVQGGGYIDSSTYAAGNAGAVNVSANQITVDGLSAAYAGISSIASNSSTGRGGNVNVTARGDLVLRNGGQLDASTYSSGNAGSVTVRATNMTIDGTNNKGVASAVFGVSAPTASGNAGNIDIALTGKLTILGPSSIDSSVYTDGDAGTVKVSADSISIDGMGLGSAGIRSQTWAPAGRKSGSVEVSAAGLITLRNAAVIDSSTQGGVDGGQVKVTAGRLLIDGQGDQDRLTGIFSSANFGSTGHGGSIDVAVAKDLTILSRGEIDGTTYSQGNAGVVKVRAGDILIDDGGKTGNLTGIFSETTSRATGNAGGVDVAAVNQITVYNGGLIDSSTFGAGNAGAVQVQAGRIVVDGGPYAYSAISSSAYPFSGGQAGNVQVTAGDLFLTNGGRVESATYAVGNAGAIHVQANTVRVEGAGSSINASAKSISTGQTGNLVVDASESVALWNGGRLTIQNDATLAHPDSAVPGRLSVSAPVITVRDGAKITAQASGNAPASPIDIRFTDRLALSQGSITTAANDGNGGAITVQGGRLVTLDRSQITTSVLGPSGNGGDITVQADALVMQTGFIQANTAARNASGGNVRIDVKTLVPSGNTLQVGGQLPYAFDASAFGFNVIQAAAPTGVSGAISVSSPILDVSASLAGLSARLLDPAALARSPCQPGGVSSLTQAGRGGFAPSAREFAAVGAPPVDGTVAALPPPLRRATPAWAQALPLQRAGCAS